MMQRQSPIVAALLALPVFFSVPLASAQDAAGLSGREPAYPTPEIVSPSWNLDLEYGTPRTIAVRTLSGGYQWYWYLPYKVTNRTGENRLFIPEVTVYTDEGDIIPAGRNVPAVVYPAIAQVLNNNLLESPVEIVGQLLQGEDYARESVAIWPAFGHDVDRMSIFFGGLSGETKTMRDPLTGEEVLLRRTRQLNYRLPGYTQTPQNQPVIFEGEREVMR